MKTMKIQQWMMVILLSVPVVAFSQDDPDLPPGDPGAPIDGYVLPMVLLAAALACVALWRTSRRANS